ncbi:hypothetical protein GGD41_000775 [Paraburkholderia bryophila]|uniref:Uncharacterized protein n=1 Tax=Paraburkholderia bryophila TaxID=420952 RepID=A0A7Y9W428_9BURK|nr:hypothetical protein [Paraburkholderia bryophila]
MKTPHEWMIEVEAHCKASAPARGHCFAVTGRVRFDCVCECGAEVVAWFINNAPATREQVGRAIVHGRANPCTPFKHKR